MKFFLKRRLFWVPILGTAWWALDFPFMKRYTLDQIRKNPTLKTKDKEKGFRYDYESDTFWVKDNKIKTR